MLLPAAVRRILSTLRESAKAKMERILVVVIQHLLLRRCVRQRLEVLQVGTLINAIYAVTCLVRNGQLVVGSSLLFLHTVELQGKSFWSPCDLVLFQN